jgi:hypothetical protein
VNKDMEIHSSSLRSLPTKLGGSQADKSTGVRDNVAREDTKAPTKRQIVDASQTPVEIEQALGRAGLLYKNEPSINDVLNKPMPTRIQQALNAYDGQRSQSIQNQRAELIIGIDFYV